MKTLLTGLAAIGMALTLPQVAQAMECCKEGKCACCKKNDEAPKPAPEAPHQH